MQMSSESFSGNDDLTKDSDLQILCSDGVRLSVHSLIMSKWSRVIHDALSSPVDGDFRVEESSSIWKEALGIIYPVTPVTIIDWENVARIFRLGDKYQMTGLQQRCEGFLLSADTKFFTNPNRSDYVLKWLAFAAQFRQTQLGEKCMNFIKTHYKLIDELRLPPKDGYIRGELASTKEGVSYIIDILQFVMQQRR
eukprot:g7859.t1